jgi:uncharacterized membrane protein YozB (DUF420 family)
MIPVEQLPALNATLNSLSAVLLLCGYVFIRRRQIFEHKLCMLAACSTSTLFLISYLIYHAQVGSKPFQGTGMVRTVYFIILISHTILATAIVPLVIMTLRRAFRPDFPAHARIARWTFPLWMYVSITGVIVYWMLYQM